MRRLAITLPMICLICLSLPFLVIAEPPPLLNYEGTLADASGNPVPDGQYEILFSIYGAATGGTALWSEQWDFASSPVVVNNGKFNVLLGAHTPIPEDFFEDKSETWLGIKVGTDVEMLPRQRLASVPYALNCNSVGLDEGGWIEAKETWSFYNSGSIDPEFTLSIPENQTGKYSPGMRIRLIQSSTVKYFLITKAFYSSPNTILTIFGGQDYNLDNVTISDPSYSFVKAPHGFPLVKWKWSVKAIDWTERSNGTSDRWVQIEPVSLRVPTGDWLLSYDVSVSMETSGGSSDPRQARVSVTLAKSPNGEDDGDFKAFADIRVNDSKLIRKAISIHREKNVFLGSATTFYLNTYFHEPKANRLVILRNGMAPMIIRAVSNYL